mmetsp:Transcript_12320/g.18375  ORF Transcript_12320/g.18375 Transcript_12320/m.18375 type:complete len:491 (+) Transcript_12320:128-1600(+)
MTGRDPAHVSLMDDEIKNADFDDEIGGEAAADRDEHLLQTFKIRRSYLYRCVITAAFGSLLLGYDLGIISGALIPIQKEFHLSHLQLQALTSSILFTSVVGSFIAGYVSDKFGRKTGLLAASVIFCGGSVGMSLSYSFTALIIWRCITGIAVGVGLVICPIFCAELSPRRMRGALTSYNELFINVGIPAAYFVGLYLRGEPNDWRWMLGSGAIPSFVLFCLTLILPESPSWMLKHGHAARAKATLMNLVSSEESSETRERVAKLMEKEMKEDMQSQKAMATWSEMVYSPSNRKPLIVGTLFAAGQQLIGTDALVFYSVLALTHWGISEQKALEVTLVMGMLKLGFTLLTTFVVDREGIGRRIPLIIGGTGCAIGMLIVSIAAYQNPSTASSAALIAGILVFMSSFGMGYGPMCWLILAEIFKGPFRSKGLSLGSVVNRLCSFLIVATYLSMVKALSLGGTFLFYTLVCLIVLGFTVAYVPDLRGKKLGVA